MTTTEEAAQTVTVVVEPLPFFFGDQSTGSLWIWIFQTVMQHSETPLTPKTLDFVDQAFERALDRLEGKRVQKLEVVK
ncbi:MAG: hypothetical protein ACK52K_18420 [Alphaproteobacteria bacterium]